MQRANALGYARPDVTMESRGLDLTALPYPPQFYDIMKLYGIGQDFENWLGKTAATLGLAWQPGPDARTSAANFFTAFENKLVEIQAREAAAAEQAQVDAAVAQSLPSTVAAETVAVQPAPVNVVSASAYVAPSTTPAVTQPTAAIVPIRSTPAASAPVSDAAGYTSYSGGGGAAFYSPASVDASALTQSALTEKPSFNWGAFLTIAAILAAGGS